MSTKAFFRTIFDVPHEEYFSPGHGLCAGCTAGTIVKLLLKVAGPNTIVVNATGCVEVSTTTYPYTSWNVPWLHVAFENAAAVASGVESAIIALKKKGVIDPSRKVNIVALAGDGGTYDIGLQALSGMLERGHHVMYVLYDNEAYMNTGIQRSGSTPEFAWTTTTPVGSLWKGKYQQKKPIAEIVSAHGIPYVATSNPNNFTDMMNKFKKGLETEGPSFVHVLQPCTTGWKFDPRYGIEISRLATETAMWINWEKEHKEFRVTVTVPRRKHVRNYLKMQGRFRHLNEQEINEIQNLVNKKVDDINSLVGKTVIGPLIE
ncbi:MAG: thiamine pyrophosphate-dependent enzyme [Conexivisphaerales archaeon]